MLSLLMSVIQLGSDLVGRYGEDVASFFEAALSPPRFLDATLREPENPDNTKDEARSVNAVTR